MPNETQNVQSEVAEVEFKEAVRKLLNTPPQHKPSKKGGSANAPRKRSAKAIDGEALDRALGWKGYD